VLAVINYMDFRHVILIPTLRYLAPEIPFSRSAEALVGGTAATESGFTRLRAASGGEGRGLYCCTPEMHRRVHEILADSAALRDKISALLSSHAEPFDQLAGNWPYATAICRVHYRQVEEDLPEDPLDYQAMASYWHRHYRDGPEADFVTRFMKTVMADPRSMQVA
jgi:hypothetical protein